MTTPTPDRARSKAFVEQYLSRRGLLAAALAGGATLTFGFHKTKAIEAQQLTGTSLYDQLGGIVGITAVITDTVSLVANDERINGFFANTIAQGRGPRLTELLIQQVAEATGGPMRYTGRDMVTVHRGRGITMAAFLALVEDLASALDQNGVSEDAKTMLLDALAPLQSQIVEIP